MSGLVLAGFLLTHFLNHALGLISLEAMEAGRAWFELLWRNPVGTLLLYGALLVHFALALAALYRRRTMQMPASEALQLAFGLCIPFLVIPHVAGTRIEHALTGHAIVYEDVIRNLWVVAPHLGAKQALALIIAWGHVCFGLYFWLRPRAWFGRNQLLLFSIALLVPLLGLLGFAQAGKEVAAGLTAPSTPTELVAADQIRTIETVLYLAFLLPIVGVLAARAIRHVARHPSRIRITYPGGRVVRVLPGFTVLEASRIASIPHVSICGGRGRCSTCRVQITAGLGGLPALSDLERKTLRSIDAAPNVRLACQLRPTHDVAVVPILAAKPERPAWIPGSRVTQGQERDIVVLFCDLRGFTDLAERRLPFDTVFLLNRYFEVVGQAVQGSGGHLDKFIGDGALALFGLQGTKDRAARQAIEAALLISQGVAKLNTTHDSELSRALRVAISVHAGPAIVGEMGFGTATSLTAVGDTINTASRLEGLAKELDAELVVSRIAADRAGLDLSGHLLRTTTVKGRWDPIDVWILSRAADARGEQPLSAGEASNA